MERLLRMLANMVLRKVMRHGIDLATRPRPGAGTATPEDAAQSRTAREIAKRARQAARLTRRF